MSSVQTITSSKFSRAALSALLLMVGAFLLISFSAGTVDAKKKVKSKASATKRLPVISRVDPLDVEIGDTLTITGKNIVKGKNKVLVMFQRKGSKRRFTSRGTGVSSTSMTVKVPDVAGDLVGGATNIFRMRLISKYGASAKWSNDASSPSIRTKPGQSGGIVDCDSDGLVDDVDPDDDNDLLSDTIEVQIGTDRCQPDTDGDQVTDYYEYRVAYAINGGPVLPYPGRRPYPNPLTADSENDWDGDQLSTLAEFFAWRYTGRMDRFYSDADQDSDDDGTFDEWEDEDGDLLPNIVEIADFGGELNSEGPIEWLRIDSDGDGLCDGLDDLDHDGPPTPNAVADCSTQVPNNSIPGDPDSSKIDGDDNIYSNWYEWFNGTNPFNPCSPSPYPISPFCPHT